MELHWLVIIVDEKPIISIPHRTTERLTSGCKVFHYVLYDSEIIVISSRFYLTDQRLGGIPFPTLCVTLDILCFIIITQFYHIVPTPARSHNKALTFYTNQSTSMFQQ